MNKCYVFFKDIDTSHISAENRREAWMPKGDVPYYDSSMRMRFESRRHKRRVLQQWGMRETGELINPDKHIGGTEKRRPSPQQERVQAWIRSHGGTEALWRRAQGG